MGYDMHTVTKDPGEDEAVAEIQTRLRAAWQEKRQDDADQISKELDAAYRSYFRLNIWGMGRARELMHGAGMLDLTPGHGDFPSPNDFGVTSEMWDDWDGEPNDKTPPRSCAPTTTRCRPSPTRSVRSPPGSRSTSSARTTGGW